MRLRATNAMNSTIQNERPQSAFQSPRANGAPRNLSPRQIELLPLSPLFEACKKAGLSTGEDTRTARLYACNRHCFMMPFDFIESWKDLLANRAQILVLTDAINSGRLTW